MVRPEIAVICAARDNIYGFPHWETVRLLIYMGCKILMTETHGTFALQSDGKTWTVNP
jgi:beta-lactamase superfamily II metal-dependent hydrolase